MRFASTVGTKYKQSVNENTSPYARSGVRMEDSYAEKTTSDGTFICIADGHGSTKIEDGVVVGGRECADVACTTAIRNATSNPNRIFAACQKSCHERRHLVQSDFLKRSCAIRMFCTASASRLHNESHLRPGPAFRLICRCHDCHLLHGCS